MSTKGFLSILIGFLVLGGSLGGAFIGGIAVGKSQPVEAAEAVQSAALAEPASIDGQRPPDQSDGGSLADLRQRTQSGQVSPEELAELRSQFQGGQGSGFGPGAGGGASFGGGGGRIFGTIETLEGNMVTVNTSQGPLQVIVTTETSVLQLAEVSVSELAEGMRVTVIGERGEDGSVEAVSIRVTPVGEDGFFGGGDFGGRQRRDGGQAP